jgi:alpha-L-fucosidase
MQEQQTILDTVDQVTASGPFAAEWESLKAYRTPEWYENGKFGIFLHWGPYSVPAFGNEWYPRNMYKEGTPEFEHHVATYGPQDQFGYKDFIPRMRYENYDPVQYAELFVEAGAKFVVPVAEHHDGFAMYDTALSRWNAARMGPKRDVVGELADAVRKVGLVYGVSSHRAEHFWFFDNGRTFPSDVQDPAFEDLYGPASPGPEDLGDLEKCPPSKAFMDNWLARTCELVDKYQPQLVWFDWWIQNQAWQPYLQKFAAYYYNRGAEWGKGVAINYKYKAFPEGTAVFDVERGQLAGIRPLLWQNDTSVSKNSWGYIEGQDYKSVDSLVDDLVDVVSKNGALLLNIGPKADGTIPEPEQQMLREIGGWLRINGEAIYETRPHTVFGEGPTEVEEGAFTDTKRQAFTGQDIRFTTKGDTLYAILLAWPEEPVVIRSLGTESFGAVADVSLLGHSGTLDWFQDANGLTVTLPTEKPCDFAYSLKVTRK